MALAALGDCRGVDARYVADQTGYSLSTIYRWAQEGYLPGTEFTDEGKVKRYLWRKGAVDAWVAATFE